MADPICAHAWISGRVQGVFFRSTTQQTAQELGLKGWVRNLADGRVEAVFEGPKDAVAAALDWCHRGSSAAEVTGVEVTYEQPEGLQEFQIRQE